MTNYNSISNIATNAIQGTTGIKESVIGKINEKGKKLRSQRQEMPVVKLNGGLTASMLSN